MDRIFPIVQRAAEGGPRACIVIRCSRCPAEAVLSSHWRGSNNGRGAAIAIHMRKAGWQIGRRPGQDLCPDCQRKRRKKSQALVCTSVVDPPKSWAGMTRGEKDDCVLTGLTSGRTASELAKELATTPHNIREFAYRNFAVQSWKGGIVIYKPDTKNTPEETLPETAGIHAEPPPAPDRDSRRLIHGEIEKYWLDERKGYAAGETDHTIARRLGVPSAWVAEVREFAFGADMTNEELVGFAADLAALAGDVARLDSAARAMAGQHATLAERLDALARRAAPLLKAVRP